MLHERPGDIRWRRLEQASHRGAEAALPVGSATFQRDGGQVSA